MQFLDARRLTGPNLLFDGPAAILDVACDISEAKAFAADWQAGIQRIVDRFGWPQPEYRTLGLSGGLSLAFTVPIDKLYTACEINEWVCADILSADEHEPVTELLERLEREAAEEANAALVSLKDRADRHGVTLLWDDDEVSLGMGRFASTWPARDLPDSPEWDRFSDIPVGLVTGTNGKTTTVRLAAHILRSAGRNVGLSSTDCIDVNGEPVDRGDWSGPGGARAVLRHKDVDAAILETARGGLLRRGLGVETAKAALITNISADHLGDFGSRSLDELLAIKWIISRAVVDDGVLILNADDERLVEKSESYPGRIDWFSLNMRNPVLERGIARGGLVFSLAGDVLSMRDSERQVDLCKAGEIPITMGGFAQHNVANALAAAALALRLGASTDDISDGLRTMQQDENPGRCNVYELDGRRVLVDFAHNPQAMQALFSMAAALPANRRVLCFGQAGDRPDALIEEMTQAAARIGLDRVIVSELANYHRGRESGEVFGVISRTLRELGMPREAILHFDEELDSLSSALEWSRAGDLIIMLALSASGEVRRYLESKGAT